MSSRPIRCAACSRRIREHHPHLSLIELETGREIPYHAKRSCQESAAKDFAAMMERGKIYILRHHHSAACPDEAPGPGCRGGCFDTPPVEVAN